MQVSQCRGSTIPCHLRTGESVSCIPCESSVVRQKGQAFANRFRKQSFIALAALHDDVGKVTCLIKYLSIIKSNTFTDACVKGVTNKDYDVMWLLAETGTYHSEVQSCCWLLPGYQLFS